MGNDPALMRTVTVRGGSSLLWATRFLEAGVDVRVHFSGLWVGGRASARACSALARSAFIFLFCILYFSRLRRSVPVPLQVDFDYGLPDLIRAESGNLRTR